jgi:hypothetical protein
MTDACDYSNTLDNDTWSRDMGWDTRSSLRIAKNVPENAYLENGSLVLRSLRQQAPGYTEGIPKILYPNTTFFDFTSAAVTTNGKRAFGGGGKTTRVCIRAQLPGGGVMRKYSTVACDCCVLSERLLVFTGRG